jgi:ribonucleoside-diphosphate reductase alpha chain
MMDNVIDRTIYPLEEQEIEAKNKRRMGLGVTGVANAAEALGLPYGSKGMIMWLEQVMKTLRNHCYLASVELAKEKGSFPLFDADMYCEGEFIKTLPDYIQERIRKYGIRNSHLLSIAPTGTISLFAGNISSGIEPPFAISYDRRTLMADGSEEWWPIYDYAYDQWDIKGVTSGQLTAEQHVEVLCTASKYIDSACSKTCNVGDEVDFNSFKELYTQAYVGGASGCTTFRPASIETRGQVMRSTDIEEEKESGVCEIDPITGTRSCAD